MNPVPSLQGNTLMGGMGLAVLPSGPVLAERERAAFGRSAMRQVVVALAVGVVLLAGRFGPAASQEVKEIALAQQFGAIFIPLMAMENMQLIEKQAQARGIGDLKVSWAKLAGTSVMVDAILSGNLHFSAQGVPSLSLM